MNAYFARERQIHQIVIALPWDAETRLLSWIKKLKSLPVDIKLCPDMIASFRTDAYRILAVFPC